MQCEGLPAWFCHDFAQFGIWAAVKDGLLDRVKELIEKRGESVESRDLVCHCMCRSAVGLVSQAAG